MDCETSRRSRWECMQASGARARSVLGERATDDALPAGALRGRVEYRYGGLRKVEGRWVPAAAGQWCPQPPPGGADCVVDPKVG